MIDTVMIPLFQGPDIFQLLLWKKMGNFSHKTKEARKDGVRTSFYFAVYSCILLKLSKS